LGKRLINTVIKPAMLLPGGNASAVSAQPVNSLKYE
jgi:hypothetical protein